MFSITKEFTIAKSCPWYEAQQSFGPPTINWCEPTICAYINEPANTWSNLAYILASVLLIFVFDKSRSKVVRGFSISVFFMGLFSGIYHASNNFATQFLDFFGMYLMTSFVITNQTLRLKGKDLTKFWPMFLILLVLQNIIFFIFYKSNIAIQHTVVLAVAPMLILEVINTLKIKDRTYKKYHFFIYSGFFMFVAQVFSQLDLRRIVCEPGNYFTYGHAIWHIFGGFGMFFLGLHLRDSEKRHEIS